MSRVRQGTRLELVPVPAQGVRVEHREPEAVWADGRLPSVVALHTHDYGPAAEVAWSLWKHERYGPLTPPERCWVQLVHKGRRRWLQKSRPGAPGAIPAVEFVLPLVVSAGAQGSSAFRPSLTRATPPLTGVATQTADFGAGRERGEA
jgi:hypothetical protein